MRRKGELSPAGIDRGWPHQSRTAGAVQCTRHGYQEIHDFCKDLTLCNRGHAVCHDRRVVQCLLLCRSRRTPINSCKGSAARNSIRSNEGRAVIGRVGISPRLPTYRSCVVAFVSRQTIPKSKSS